MTRRPTIELADIPQCSIQHSINHGAVAGRSGFTASVFGSRHKCWLVENQGAIDTYNQRIEANGVFGDSLRLF